VSGVGVDSFEVALDLVQLAEDYPSAVGMSSKSLLTDKITINGKPKKTMNEASTTAKCKVSHAISL
jgi:hypothetical protein